MGEPQQPIKTPRLGDMVHFYPPRQPDARAAIVCRVYEDEYPTRICLSVFAFAGEGYEPVVAWEDVPHWDDLPWADEARRTKIGACWRWPHTCK